jgi:hypothetical protein
MLVDFINLNEFFPKNSLPLLRIDKLMNVYDKILANFDC